MSAGACKINNFGFIAPVPDFGIWGGYAFSKKFATNFDVNYLTLTIGNKSRRILATNLLFTY